MERHHSFDFATKIGRQSSGFLEELVKLDLKDGGDALD
jgi:hypothetical protein